MKRRQKAEAEDSFSSVPEPLRSWLNGSQSWWEAVKDNFKDGAIQLIQQNSGVIVIAIGAFIRATGTLVKSGQTGMLFSFGRAKRELQPGFHLLIPFLQKVRKLPTRQRTLDLPAQRVTTSDGLVYFVDANIVFRISDVRKATVEIDDLIKGMRQVLVLSVQEVLRNAKRESLRVPENINKSLSDAMSVLLEPWGVELQSAGFTSINPSPASRELVQLSHRVDTRRSAYARLKSSLPRHLSLPLLGSNQRIITRSELLLERELKRRRYRRVRRTVRAEVIRSGLKLTLRQRRQLDRQARIEAGLSPVLNF